MKKSDWQECSVCNDPLCTVHQTHIYDRHGIRYGVEAMAEKDWATLAEAIMAKILTSVAERPEEG